MTQARQVHGGEAQDLRRRLRRAHQPGQGVAVQAQLRTADQLEPLDPLPLRDHPRRQQQLRLAVAHLTPAVRAPATRPATPVQHAAPLILPRRLQSQAAYSPIKLTGQRRRRSPAKIGKPGEDPCAPARYLAPGVAIETLCQA